jgi:hypothetical protein
VITVAAAHVRSAPIIDQTTSLGIATQGQVLERLDEELYASSHNSFQWYKVRFQNAEAYVATAVASQASGEQAANLCATLELDQHMLMLPRAASVFLEKDVVLPAGTLLEVEACENAHASGCTVTTGHDGDGDGPADVYTLQDSIETLDLRIAGSGAREDLDICPPGWGKLGYADGGATIEGLSPATLATLETSGYETGSPDATMAVVPWAGAMRLVQAVENGYAVEIPLPSSATAKAPRAALGKVFDIDIRPQLDRCAPWGLSQVRALGSPIKRIAATQWDPVYLGAAQGKHDLFRLRNLSSATRNIDGRVIGGANSDAHGAAGCENSFNCAVCANNRDQDFASGCAGFGGIECAADYVCETQTGNQCQPFHALAYDSGGSWSLGGGADIAILLLHKAVEQVTGEAMPDQATTARKFGGEIRQVCRDNLVADTPIDSFDFPSTLPAGTVIIAGTTIEHVWGGFMPNEADHLSTRAFLELWTVAPADDGAEESDSPK